MTYTLHAEFADPTRKLSETESRVAWLGEAALSCAIELRDGTLPQDQRARASRAVVDWLVELNALGASILVSTRTLEVTDVSIPEVSPVPPDTSEPADPTPVPEADETISLPAEPKQRFITNMGPLLGDIEPGRILLSDQSIVECTRNYAAAAVRATAGQRGHFQVRGDCSAGVNKLGGGNTPWAADSGWWDRGPLTVGFIGIDEYAALGEITMRENMNDDDGVTRGVACLWLEKLKVIAHNSSAINTMKGDTLGELVLRNVELHPDPIMKSKGEYGGYGFKWGMRCNGRGRYDIKGLICEPVQEHACYVDQLTGDSYFWDVRSKDSWRTAIQIVSRSVDNPGPVSTGRLWIKDLQASFVSPGEGGAAVTIAGGHDGEIIIDGIYCKEEHDGKHNHAAVVIWVTAKDHHGAYVERLVKPESEGVFASRLFAYPQRIVLNNINSNMALSDRDAVSIRGAKLVEIGTYSLDVIERADFCFDGPYQIEGDMVSIDGASPYNYGVGFEDLVLNGEEKFIGYGPGVTHSIKRG